MPMLLLLLALAAVARADIRDTHVKCDQDSILFAVNTTSEFSGRIFALGESAAPECRVEGDGRQRYQQLSLAFQSCQLEHKRIKNGVFVSGRVIVAFHETFLTKRDRLYSFHCFYMEAAKPIITELTVRMLTTSYQERTVPMPVCRYQIVDTQTRQPIRYAIIGQPVLHQWTCDAEVEDAFCMHVHHCLVDDGTGDRLDILDPNGCAVDRHLLADLDYTADLNAQQESHVFKYRDRAALFFECQISLSIKEPDGQCARPECLQPWKALRSRRLPRDVAVASGAMVELRRDPREPGDPMDPPPNVCIDGLELSGLALVTAMAPLMLLHALSALLQRSTT